MRRCLGVIHRLSPWHSFSSLMATITRRALKYDKFGDPRQVIYLSTDTISTDLSPGEVLVEWIYAPINPLDINRIQGAYVIREELPCIAGSEGAGKVVKAHGSCSLRVGDLVCVLDMPHSVWSECSVHHEAALVKMDARIDPLAASIFLVNPCTVWVMLTQYVKMREGDWVVQNSANSGVGRIAIQMCKAMGYHTINVVRDRKDIKALKDELRASGADHVLTEEEFAKEGKKLVKSLGAPVRLAFNGVGGRSALAIASVLERGGTCVVYGGMSKKPHEFSTSSLVFNQITVTGVANGMWMRDDANEKEVERMMREVQDLFVSGALRPPPMERRRLDEYKDALEKTMRGGELKQIFHIGAERSRL